MKITEQQIGVITQQHQQWLDNPITKYMIGVLEKREKRVVDELMNNSLINTSTPVEAQKQIAFSLSVQLKTTTNIKSSLTETDKFIKSLL